MGGRHAGLGTWNAILPLEGGVYVELIAPDPESTAPRDRLPFGLAGLEAPRLATWSARTTDLEAAVEGARSAGYDAGAIVPLHRELPDGTRLDWRLTIRAEPAFDGVVPFLIDWEDAPHPSAMTPTRCRLDGFGAFHPDAAGARAALGALGLEGALAVDPVEAGREGGLRAMLEGPGGRLELGG